MCREHNAALLLVSHDPDVLRVFDRVEDFAKLNRAIAPSGAGDLTPP